MLELLIEENRERKTPRRGVNRRIRRCVYTSFLDGGNIGQHGGCRNVVLART